MGGALSHPKDFTPVCTTELGRMAQLAPEFRQARRQGSGPFGRSGRQHALWANDIAETQGAMPQFPMIGDPTLAVAKLYDMLPATAGDSAEGRTAADNQTVRHVFVIGPDTKIKLMIAYPMTTGRNIDEILRVIDSLQLTATPSGRDPGRLDLRAGCDHCRSVSNDEAKDLYPDGWAAPNPYLRIVPQPGLNQGRDRMTPRILILGAGFGGLELSTSLSEAWATASTSP